MTATAIRIAGVSGSFDDELPGADVVAYLDLDGDRVPDAVRTTTYLPMASMGEFARVAEIVEAVDDDGNVRLISLAERFEPSRSTAVA